MNTEIQTEISTEIKVKNEALDAAISEAKSKVGKCVSCARDLGDSLIQLKEMILHGNWEVWMRENLPKINIDRARASMRISKGWEENEALRNANSFREAIAICCEKSQEEKQTKMDYPVYIQATGLITRVMRFVKSFPLGKWPEENREAIKSRLEPLAKEIWPEKFP